MKGVSRSTRRLAERLPLDIALLIIRAHYGPFDPWLPRSERRKSQPTGGGRNASR